MKDRNKAELRAITLQRSGKVSHSEVLDVLEFMADEYGSATNAAVQCIRQSDLYRSSAAKMADGRRLQKRT